MKSTVYFLGKYIPPMLALGSTIIFVWVLIAHAEQDHHARICEDEFTQALSTVNQELIGSWQYFYRDADKRWVGPTYSIDRPGGLATWIVARKIYEGGLSSPFVAVSVTASGECRAEPTIAENFSTEFLQGG